MCGICGIFNFDENTPVDALAIKEMTATMKHRGPDDEGYYLSGSLGLGFRRLSIIDLSGGHQPMSNSEENIWVVFNGEIYNFPDLKKVLQSCGYVFRTKSDTEVIIHGYKQWGNEVVQHLNGMFGLAIWDESQKILTLARDRMGVKFIYYMIDNNKLIFGSEIRPILAYLEYRPEIDRVGIYQFLRYRFVPSPNTIYKGIQKLAAGTQLIASQNGEIKKNRWWKYKPAPFEIPPSIEEARIELKDIYSKAVKRQLISDVPLGLLLSGGVDSGLLLALMNENGDMWHTYSVGYGKAFRDDELEDAKETASILNAPNRSIKIDIDIFEKNLSEIISAVEEPIAPSSIVPMYFVCRLARQEVKVALIGQGPDELFGGYKRHLGVHYGKYWRALPNSIRKILKRTLVTLPRNETVKRGLYSLDVEHRMSRYREILSLLSPAGVMDLFKNQLVPLKIDDKILQTWRELEPLMENLDELTGFQFLEVRCTLPDELLLYADKLSMANGLELRVPYLDQEVVEYVERLNATFKVRNGHRKYLHKKVCAEMLPEKIIKRKKRGFAVNVVDEWFRNNISKLIDNSLMNDDAMIYQYLKPQSVSRLVQEHRDGKNNHHKILYSLVVLEKFLKAD